MCLLLYAFEAQVWNSKPLDTDSVFTSIAIITMVTQPLDKLISSLPNLPSSLAAFDSIQTYLSNASHGGDPRRHLGKTALSLENDLKIENVKYLAIAVRGLFVQPSGARKPLLKDISLRVEKGLHVMVTGAVGSGKTVLAKTILGEIPINRGSISVSSKRFGYCSQTAWLTNATFKKNICGPTYPEYVDEEWYQTVVYACDLEEVIETLPSGNETILGSRGATLSGGQRQRVALARTIYARTDIVILDDVLSAVDNETEMHITERLFGADGILRKLGTTVILITPTTRYARISDYIVILSEDGGIFDQGTKSDLEARKIDVPGIVGKSKNIRCEDRDPFQDTHVSIPSLEQTNARKLGQDRDADRRGLYSYYFGAFGESNLALLTATTASSSIFLMLTHRWLQWWAETANENIWFFSVGYTLVSAGNFVSLNSTNYVLLLLVTPRSGHILHDRLLQAVINAPYTYFTTHDMGNILDRFIEDIKQMDNRLPLSILLVTKHLLRVLGQCILLYSLRTSQSRGFAFLMIICLFIVYKIAQKYLRASQQLKQLDSEARSLINTDVLETAEGITTIRAFEWQKYFAEDSIKKLDKYQQTTYTLNSLEEWLCLVLDLMIAVVASIVIITSVIYRSKVTGAETGMALSVVLNAGFSFLALVECWTAFETTLGCVGRLKNFVEDVKGEEKARELETLSESSTWPPVGAVKFEKVTAGYR